MSVARDIMNKSSLALSLMSGAHLGQSREQTPGLQSQASLQSQQEMKRLLLCQSATYCVALRKLNLSIFVYCI